MIFLSAQPDTYYFTWQLELQVFNFSNLGIAPNDINILIGYNPALGPEKHFEELIEKLESKASFFTYPDNRLNSKYASSVRPHIVQQHFLRFPELQQEIIFYHDSDIIFRELPDFSGMLSNETWYVSDTRSYLDSNYIKRFGGDKLLSQMCNIVGIDPLKVVAQDMHCGGAQYLLKNVPVEFWEKLEKDSESLYILMNKFNAEKGGIAGKSQNVKKIQAWCADMWALLWNALLYEKTVEIHKDLDFCWANTPVEMWDKTKILHYTGHVEKAHENIFRKLNYSEFEPYYDLLLQKIDAGNCSAPLVRLISDYLAALELLKARLPGVLLVLLFDSGKITSADILVTHLRYLEKFLRVNIHIIEKGKTQLYSGIKGLKKYSYTFLCNDEKDSLPIILREVTCKQQVDVIAIIEADTFLETGQYLEAVERIHSGQAEIVVPVNHTLLKVGRHFQSIFDKCLDPGLLRLNKGKFNSYPANDIRSVFCSRETFSEMPFDDCATFNDIFKIITANAKPNPICLDYPVYCFIDTEAASD